MLKPLQKLDPYWFVSLLLATPPESFRRGFMFFKSRYADRVEDALDELEPEHRWFEDVVAKLRAELEAREGIEFVRFQSALKLYVEPAERAWREKKTSKTNSQELVSE